MSVLINILLAYRSSTLPILEAIKDYDNNFSKFSQLQKIPYALLILFFLCS